MEEEEGEFNSSGSFLFHYISFVISAGMKYKVMYGLYTLCNTDGGREGGRERYLDLHDGCII